MNLYELQQKNRLARDKNPYVKRSAWQMVQHVKSLCSLFYFFAPQFLISVLYNSTFWGFSKCPRENHHHYLTIWKGRKINKSFYTLTQVISQGYTACISAVWEPAGEETSSASGLGGLSSGSCWGLKSQLLKKPGAKLVLRVIQKAKDNFLCLDRSRNDVCSFLQHCTKISFSKSSPILVNRVINILMISILATICIAAYNVQNITLYFCFYLQQNQGKCPAQNCSLEAPAWMPVHHCTVSLVI